MMYSVADKLAFSFKWTWNRQCGTKQRVVWYTSTKKPADLVDENRGHHKFLIQCTTMDTWLESFSKLCCKSDGCRFKETLGQWSALYYHRPRMSSSIRNRKYERNRLDTQEITALECRGTPVWFHLGWQSFVTCLTNDKATGQVITNREIDDWNRLCVCREWVCSARWSIWNVFHPLTYHKHVLPEKIDVEGTAAFDLAALLCYMLELSWEGWRRR